MAGTMNSVGFCVALMDGDIPKAIGPARDRETAEFGAKILADINPGKVYKVLEMKTAP